MGGGAGGKGYCRQHVNVIFPDPISSVDSTTAAVRQATCAQQICHAKQQLFFSSSFLMKRLFFPNVLFIYLFIYSIVAHRSYKMESM